MEKFLINIHYDKIKIHSTFKAIKIKTYGIHRIVNFPEDDDSYFSKYFLTTL